MFDSNKLDTPGNFSAWEICANRFHFGSYSFCSTRNLGSPAASSWGTLREKTVCLVWDELCMQDFGLICMKIVTRICKKLTRILFLGSIIVCHPRFTADYFSPHRLGSMNDYSVDRVEKFSVSRSELTSRIYMSWVFFNGLMLHTTISKCATSAVSLKSTTCSRWSFASVLIAGNKLLRNWARTSRRRLKVLWMSLFK